VPKAFDIAESISKLASLPLAGFQKWWALCCPLFKRKWFIATYPYLQGFKNRRDCLPPCRFSKALGRTLRRLLSISWKGFEFAGFKKLTANLEALGAKWLRIY
jgi:hypothetical protein